MQVETLVFDLDDTVYPPTSGIWEAVGVRMESYMVEKLSMPKSTVKLERERLFHKHGTTMRGLVTEYGIDDIDFLDYVHNIPVDDLISENPQLRDTLLQFPQRKIIFTNANNSHATRVLSALGIFDLFEQIIDILAIKPYCKPQTEAFEIALELSGIQDAHQCVMIDDAQRNLITAHKFGFYTVQVGADNLVAPIDAVISSLEELPRVLPTITIAKGSHE